MMDIHELKKQIAQYETAIEHLEAELSYINRLMQVLGFEEGLKTVRESAEELKDKKNSDDDLEIEIL